MGAQMAVGAWQGREELTAPDGIMPNKTTEMSPACIHWTNHWAHSPLFLVPPAQRHRHRNSSSSSARLTRSPLGAVLAAKHVRLGAHLLSILLLHVLPPQHLRCKNRTRRAAVRTGHTKNQILGALLLHVPPP